MLKKLTIKYIAALLVSLACSFAFAEKKTTVILEHSETLSFDKASGREFQVLRGNVRFRHENALMYCDSAYFYDGQNSFDAFGHVRVVQGDSLSMTAHKMFYDGNTKVMRVRGNVVLDNKTMQLYTEQLDYYRIGDYGYFFDGGKLVDPNFEIVSKFGYYYTNLKVSTFKTDVVLTNPDFIIKSDTLSSNSATNIATLVGPSHVYYGDNYTVYTTDARMNTVTNSGQLYNYSVITSNDGKRITADSIHFDKAAGIAKAFHNVDVQDSARSVSMKGNYAICHQTPQSAMVTDSAYIMEFSGKDTLFLHADSLFYTAFDSVNKVMSAYHNVRFFRKDMQGKCDSLNYVTKDSIINMYVAPVLWANQSQMTGDSIKLYMNGTNPDWFHIIGNALICQREDKDNFSQLAGKESKGYMKENDLRQVDMLGNAISVYFPKDDNGNLVGINKAEGSMMSIFMMNKKLEKIKMTPDSQGVMYPPFEAPEEELFLKGFTWQENIRPKKMKDIFLKY